eukprot:gb/GFBE01032045.1/.p1 GENE.gb/GFBE01032045.1/~~gb/GFBE01032045.1/.p1  ORF type:complete len:898 (+),score=127.44 gb/GFBE01032045.1/:1-2694(+)
MTLGLQWIVDKITFPSPPSSYSLTSHPELFFVQPPKSRPSHPGVPCMLYAVRQGAPVLLVHAHSNGCDIGDMRQTLQSISESLKVHVMSFEFPGYGLHLGSANMRSIDDAAAAVLNYIVNDLKINLSQVVWYGRSIGSGPAIRAVHRISKELNQQPGGLVVQCGFANFPEVAGHLFGRVAKRLVSRLWPNEAMLKELHCPVLLIHGRNDTMIPISQSEKLWAAVSMKELSHFHTCDCGHNDFNFRRCTLRPIYDFLLGVISAPNFPATNFNIEVDPTHRAFVHHIGPLRCKIPVYSFRRPDLEDWLRRIGGLTAKRGAGGNDADDSATEATSPPSASPESAKAISPSDLDHEAAKVDSASKLQAEGRDLKAAPQTPPPKRPPKGKKGKGAADLPPIPDYSAMPAIEDIEKALLEPEGLVRTCAARVSLFLDRVQRQLDRIEGLEQKSLEEVSEFVEAEFWACDPLLCLWEEVSLPSADVVRYRLGPFSIDNQGNRSYHPGLGSGSSHSTPGPNLLRVPQWTFCPSQAHFRCLAEWSLVNSERLQQKLPSGKSSSGSCCCVPSPAPKKKSGKKDASTSMQPTKGALATSLAAHFANWVDKNEDIRGTFDRFVRLYKDPETALQRLALASPTISRGPPVQEMAVGDTTTPCSGCSPSKVPIEEEQVFPPNSLANSGSVTGRAAREGQTSALSALPWQAHRFSMAARSHLLLGLGPRCQTFLELSTRLNSFAPASIATAEREEGQALPNLADFQSTAEYVASPSPFATAERYMDWAVAGLLLHYERLLAGAGPTGEMPAASLGQEVGDPTRPDVRRTGISMSKAMKAFANADLRERREHQRVLLRAQLPRGIAGVLKPSDPDGDVDINPPSPPPEGGARVQAPMSVTPGGPGGSSQVEGL